jgi:hypothetical protein
MARRIHQIDCLVEPAAGRPQILVNTDNEQNGLRQFPLPSLLLEPLLHSPMQKGRSGCRSLGSDNRSWQRPSP